MSEVLGRLNAVIEAQGPDQLWVDARDALASAYQTISDLREKVESKSGAVTTMGDVITLLQREITAKDAALSEAESSSNILREVRDLIATNVDAEDGIINDGAEVLDALVAILRTEGS